MRSWSVFSLFLEAQGGEEVLKLVERHEAGDCGRTGARAYALSSSIVVKFLRILNHILGYDEIVVKPG